MSEATSRKWVDRYFDEVTNKGQLDIADQLFAVDYVHHDPANPDPHGVKGVADVKRHLAELLHAFPDTKFHVDAVVAEGDNVVARWTATCTHTGDYFGIPPTNKAATITGMNTWRITDGLAVEGWVNRDDLQLLQQLGVIPSPGA
ncbi:MAG TPA: ester cyclase [Vicinamibacterales bacterium]|nr:ester cyclase [Vicinamibacterales bacterium]